MKQGIISFAKFLQRYPLSAVGFVIVFGLFILVIIGPRLAPYPAETPNPAEGLLPPSFKHLLGTDKNGMDVLSRIIAAPRVDIAIAASATVLAIVLGLPIGVVMGYSRTVGSEIVMRLIDVLHAFPIFILAMALVALGGQTITNLIYALAFLSVPTYVRLVRSHALSVRERMFVEAARSIGISDLAIIFRHVLPNCIAPIFIQASVTIGVCMFLTAGLSFVGAGVRAPTPEWGSMISIGAPNILTGEWWPSLFPGIALGITVLGFAMIGDGLQRLTDPKRR